MDGWRDGVMDGNWMDDGCIMVQRNHSHTSVMR